MNATPRHAHSLAGWIICARFRPCRAEIAARKARLRAAVEAERARLYSKLDGEPT